MSDAIALAERLGLRPDRKRADCPCCGYKGSLAILPGRRGRSPRLWCANGCSSSDLALVAGAPIRSFGAQDAARVAARVEQNRERAEKLWRGSMPCPGTIAEQYLRSRGIASIAASPALRFRPDCPHPVAGRLPALVAAVTNASGNFVGLHRTYLLANGSGKASVDPQKASLGPIWGGAIRLAPLPPVASELVVAEGLETAAAAGVLIGLPAWAAISAGNLERALVLPPEVRLVRVAADPDPHGERAAIRAALRWQAEGRTVRISRPNPGRGDFNDILLARMARASTEGAADGR